LPLIRLVRQVMSFDRQTWVTALGRAMSGPRLPSPSILPRGKENPLLAPERHLTRLLLADLDSSTEMSRSKESHGD
jgi:hypothetical protein